MLIEFKLAQRWRKAEVFRYFRCLKTCATLMRDNGRDRSGGFQPPISAARLINDDSICATMEILRN
ncbi:MAG: hypothetical protein WCH39_24390, partial [Schlesneria sp.]